MHSSSEVPSPFQTRVTLPRRRLGQVLKQALESSELDGMRRQVERLHHLQPQRAGWGQGEGVEVVWSIWQGQLKQIQESRSLERARHYLRRLQRSLDEVKTPTFSDINLCRWQEYQDLWTDSLWNIPRRDRSGQHSSHYWGNFVPQIPHQLMRRFSKAGDWVLDPFLGSGTTLIEARRLGRHALGVELQEAVAHETTARIHRESNPFQVQSIVERADSAGLNFPEMLARHQLDRVQLAILHPPYHDIIRFSDSPEDLSNQPGVDEFIEGLARVVEGVSSVLQRKRFMALVLGDKYSGQNWVPLGFLAMQRILQQGFHLKSIVVKNFEETLGKRNQRELWRYRALAGGFYVFKHEYIFLFQKK